MRRAGAGVVLLGLARFDMLPEVAFSSSGTDRLKLVRAGGGPMSPVTMIGLREGVVNQRW